MKTKQRNRILFFKRLRYIKQVANLTGCPTMLNFSWPANLLVFQPKITVEPKLGETE